MKIEERTSGRVAVDCLSCGAMYEVPDWRHDEFAEYTAKCLEQYRKCPACEAAELAAEQAQAELAAEAKRQRELPDLVRQAGIPDAYMFDRATGKMFAEPPARYAAEWIWRHRRENLLISGETGTGKSTSACFVAAKMIAGKSKVRYTSLRKLLSSWRAARMGDCGADETLLNRIFRAQEVLIIDEVVGKAKVSDSGQELLFDLLEAVYNGECRSRIWLLGNFYAGSIDEIFADPAPARRRLSEKFSCVRLTGSTVEPVAVFRGR